MSNANTRAKVLKWHAEGLGADWAKCGATAPDERLDMARDLAADLDWDSDFETLAQELADLAESLL